MFDIININQSFVKNTSNLKERKSYHTQLENTVGVHNITIITGLRRSGKSSIVLKYLENKENIFYFSKELDPKNSIKNNEDLLALFIEFGEGNSIEYIVIDEIQDIYRWEIFIRYVYALKKYKIIITGSNSKLLSSELSTFLAGRYIEIFVYSLSLQEFLTFQGDEFSQKNMKQYFIFGGLPEIVNLQNDEVKQNYLKVVKDSIILSDIVARYHIRDYPVFLLLIHFLADNIGNLTTGRNINNFLKNEGIKIALSTMLEYINYGVNTFVWDKVNRYDLKGKKVLEISNKYYFSDLGIRSAISQDFTTKDIGQILENFVYIELRKQKYEVFIGNIGELEIDFVSKKGNITQYFQVSYLLSDEKTLSRELESLRQIKDDYDKYIITLDEYKLGNYEGIRVISIQEFLQIIIK